VSYARYLLEYLDIVVQIDQPHFDPIVKFSLEVEGEMAAKTDGLVPSRHECTGQVAADKAVRPEYSYNNHLFLLFHRSEWLSEARAGKHHRIRLLCI
jgi:hypothetical protein